MSALQSLVHAADEAALLRAVDGLCASRQWDELVDLARRCRDAVELGKQLWPVAMHIDYRLALEAPAPYAAAVLRPGAARFALGPLTEVAAGSHRWAALAPHIPDPASAATVAQERVIRGEDLTALDDGIEAEVPLRLTRWEPCYALPRYRDREAVFPQPEAASRTPGRDQARKAAVRLSVERESHPGGISESVERESHPGGISESVERESHPGGISESVERESHPGGISESAQGQDSAGEEALRELVEVWSTQSAGRVATVTVEGDAEDALGHLLMLQGGEPAAVMQRLDPGEALAVMQWAGASGGAYGRRRGGARGRFAAWWAAVALCGLDWPVEPEELGAGIGELQWYRWTGVDADVGWSLRLAVHDPLDGLAWAIDATDQRD